MRLFVEIDRELIEELVWELSHEEIIEFIVNIDGEVSSSVFTKMLKKAIEELE